MSEQKMSQAFQIFFEAPAHAQAWMEAVRKLDQAGALDKKTEELAHLAVLAALRLESSMPLQVQMAKQAGASRAQVISAVLLGLPVAGQALTQVLPTALAAYEAG